MKQECATYLKTIGKSKALTTTLSNTKPEDDLEKKDDGILNAFSTTVNPIEGIVENMDKEQDLVESKFEKMDEQDDIHIALQKYTKYPEKHENFESSNMCINTLERLEPQFTN